jgi:DNA-binding CsgD family transcriptional regulator
MTNRRDLAAADGAGVGAPESEGRVVRKVVTHRALLGAWEAAMKCELPAASFPTATRDLIERVRKSHERVDWDDYLDLTDTIREIVGSRAEMARVFSSHLGAIPEVGRIAKLFLTPRQIYRFLVYTFAAAGFSHVSSSMEDLGRDNIRIRVVVPSQYREGTSFFEASAGALRVFPAYIGLPFAEVSASISSHEATFDLELPTSRTLADRMAPAVRAALDELAFYADEIRDLTQGASRTDGRAAVDRAARRFALTRRQREVARLLMRGASNKEIAAELGCAERTVELHVTALMRKTGTANRTQLAAMLLS